MLPFRPAFRREYEAELNLTLPMRPWELRSGGVGGWEISAAGVPESFVIRVDRLADLTLRVLETELEDVIAELEAIRAASEPFYFAFDQDDSMTEYFVYLHAPVWPEEIAPDRDDEYVGLFLLRLTLRTVDGSGFLTTWLEQETS
jgi:hypothetical protein